MVLNLRSRVVETRKRKACQEARDERSKRPKNAETAPNFVDLTKSNLNAPVKLSYPTPSPDCRRKLQRRKRASSAPPRFLGIEPATPPDSPEPGPSIQPPTMAIVELKQWHPQRYATILKPISAAILKPTSAADPSHSTLPSKASQTLSWASKAVEKRYTEYLGVAELDKYHFRNIRRFEIESMSLVNLVRPTEEDLEEKFVDFLKNSSSHILCISPPKIVKLLQYLQTEMAMFSNTVLYASCTEWLLNGSENPVVQNVARTTLFLFEILKEQVTFANPALFGLEGVAARTQCIQQATNSRLLKLMDATLGPGIKQKKTESSTTEDWECGHEMDGIDAGANTGAEGLMRKRAKLSMKFFLDIIRIVAESFEELVSNNPSTYRDDLGVIATAGMFQEHCQQHHTFLRYFQIAGMKGESRKFFTSEWRKALFCTPVHQRWMERLLAWDFPLPTAQVYVAPDSAADIYSPVHLIVDALVSVYGHREEIEHSLNFPRSFFKRELRAKS